MFRVKHYLLVVFASVLIGFGPVSSPALAQDADAKLAKEEIEALLAPIALYPDALLAQVLMASTYPLEIVQAARWSKANPALKDKALADAMEKQSWDPSVKSLTAVPQVLQMMNDRLDWTQQLGDAFLAQKDEVMTAVQSLRARAKEAGKLESSKEMKVTTTTSTAPPPATPGAPAPPPQTIIIESAQPDVVYVPAYNPTVIYGTWPYPAYTPMTWYPPGYVAGNLISFGLGVATGAAIWGGLDWGRRDVNINVNRYNNFNRTNINNNNWTHNELHRKGVPYRDRDVANRFNKGGRSDAAARDRFRGRQEAARPGGDRHAARPGDRPGTRPGARPGDRAGVHPGQRPGPNHPGANRPGANHPGANRPAARPNVASHNRPTGMQHPHATHNVNNGAAARNFSNRGAASRSHSMAAHPPAAHRGGRRR